MKSTILAVLVLSLTHVVLAQSKPSSDWNAKYEKLLKSNAELRAKVESGAATKEQVIAWMKGQASKRASAERKPVARKRTELNLTAFKQKLQALVKRGVLTKKQAAELYASVVGAESGIGKKGKPTKSKTDWDVEYEKLLKSNPAVRAKVEAGTATKKQVIDWLKQTRSARRKGVNGADYKITSLAEQKRLSKILPRTSTGDDREGPVACGFFGWAANAKHRFMDNSHQGKPRAIHGLSFRLDYRDHNTIGRTWDKVTIRIAHGDWKSIKYNSSREFQLVDKATVVFNKEWSFPTLKGFPALRPAEWGGPQNCLNFRFDKPFQYNGKDAIYVEFVFEGGKAVDGRKWEGDLPYGFEYFLDSMPEAGGWRTAERPKGLYRAPRVEAVVSYTAGGQSVWTSAAKGMPYLKWDFKPRRR